MSQATTNTNPTPDNISQRERRRILLKEIDNAKFGWFHIRACIVSGIGFFTDAYDLFAINIVSTMLAYVYFGTITLPGNLDTGLKISAAVGTLVGQLLFGWLADVLGLELIIMIVATFGSAIASNSFAVSVIGLIIFWRVILGIGVGGDYPLSAVITSEFATTKRRGAMIAAVFAMQGFGILASALISYITLLGYKSYIESNIQALDYCWRIVIGLGAVPAFVALYYRLTIPETPRFTIDIEGNYDQASKDVITYIPKSEDDNTVSATTTVAESQVINPLDSTSEKKSSNFYTWGEFWSHFGQWKHGKVLLGTSLSWFALDVAFYGLGLNNAIILDAIGLSSKTDDQFTGLANIALGNVVITLLGTIPGYWVTVFTVDKIGRKTIQLLGFTMLTILFIILGFGYHAILDKSVVLFIFFQNFGPNTTTFIIPGEVFPTKYRSTAFGISAASGKFGAIVAQIGFFQMKDIGGKNAFLPHLFEISALIMFIGLLATFLVPETKGISLEDLAGLIFASNTVNGEARDMSADPLFLRKASAMA
ncbi:24323_t:CDS:2 [Entrophospora sp. SA101]|nr:24323_t:CDS:2 [Entrophospora sp. SA101]